MDIEEYRALGRQPRKSKYRAQPTVVDGERFPSKGEAERWEYLKLLQRAGKITDLARQVPYALVINGTPILIRSDGYPNGRVCRYTLDFVYRELPEDVTVYEEFKGKDTMESRLRRAVFEAIYGVRVRVTRKK